MKRPIIEQLQAENETLRAGIQSVAGLISESGGVYGLHPSGNPAPWDSLQTGGQFEGWLRAFDEALALMNANLAAKPQTAPAHTPVTRRVPGCGEWEDEKDCAYLFYLALDGDDSTDHVAEAHDDGDWWAYRPGRHAKTIAKGRAIGNTPAERLAAAKRAAEDALIAEAARVAAELQQEKAAQTTYGGEISFATSDRCASCGDARPANDGDWVDVEIGVARCASCTPSHPRHNSADDVPTQTAWEVAVSLYPHARYVAYDVGVRAIAERVFRTGQPVDAAEAELFGVYLAGRIEGRIIPELFGEGAQGRAAWSAAVDAAIQAPAEIGPPAGTHDALPEPTRNGCDGGQS